MTPAETPRVRGNDYSVLRPPDVGTWTPGLRVSVVVPAYNGQEKLDLVLAGLADQTYPAALTEVIVVDNGSVPPLRLPEVRPERTRLIVCASPGRANARNAGLRAAEGDVIHWLDSDIVLERTALEAHMRWHHLAPYLVVTGYLRFSAAPLPEPREIVSAGERGKLFEPAEPHDWIVELVERTDGLRTNAHRAFSIHIGGATSVNARLIEAAGPMDEELILGQDTEMGYRLSQAGAVFIPEPVARGYHLGPTMRMRDAKSIGRNSHALIPDRIPHYRWLRSHPARQWLVPYAEVEIDASAATYEDVRATVDAVLAGTVPDVAVVLVGPWDELDPERRSPLTDPRLDLVLIRGHYANDGRVRLGETTRAGEAGPTLDSAPFVLRLPPGWVPGEDSLAGLLDLARDRGLGLLSVLLEEGPEGIVAARLERTAAFARARIVAEPGEDLDGAVTEVYGSMWVSGETWGFLPAASARTPVGRRTAYRARIEAEAEVERLTKEVERLKGKVADWRGDAQRWRASAVELRREVGSLRKQVSALKRAQGFRGLARRLRRPFTDT
ncbi:glycosyltransferase [Planotetraspora sp. GP83]|uniref:glycosyltransferase n=1 Tax=Planotetraspora sp. GP83 TaxID=3156264 RepID=UPI0035172E33